MKNIKYEKIVDTVAKLCIDSCYELPPDVLDAIKSATKTDTNPAAVSILNQLIENAEIASTERIPLCQGRKNR